VSLKATLKNPISIGRIVHYVMWNGEHRPAIVVRVWGASSAIESEAGLTEFHPAVQLQVFTDGKNDESPNNTNQPAQNVEWRTSVGYDEAFKTANTWHWPEQVG
jgi:hypothetical protein